MPLRRRNLLIICISLLLFQCTFYQTFAQQNRRFTTYTINDGLAQNSVQSIAQDKDDFLWIGTEGGLSRFDGYHFKTYRHNVKDPHSIIGDKSVRFYLDSEKQFWVLTYNGISLYNPDHDNFTCLLSIEPKNVITAENNFFGEDKQFIYAGICEYGIVRIDKRTHLVSKIDIKPINLINAAHSWYQGFLNNNDLWITANSRLIIYNLKNHQTTRVNTHLYKVENMNAGQALGIDSAGVILINKKTLATNHFSLVQNGIEPNLSSILKLSDTVAMLGSGRNGIFYFNTSAKKVTGTITTVGDNKHKLAAGWCFYRDKSDNIYIGSGGEGFTRMNHLYKNFKLYHSTSTANFINSIYADANSVYLGNGGVGFNIYRRGDNQLKNVTIHDKLPAAANSVNAMLPLSKGKFLMISASAMNGGHSLPYVFDVATNKMQLLDNQVQTLFAQNWGQGNFRHFIFRDKDGIIATNVGECLISLKQTSDQQFVATLNHRFTGESMSSWFNDRAGNVWIGTYKGVYRRVNNVWEKVPLPKQTEVKTINQDNAGNMWLGTNFGIYVLNNQLKVINYYTEANGLLNEHLYGILKDDDGNMWFSTNKGIGVYYFNKKAFRVFTSPDGIQGDEFNAAAYFKATNGELYFGGMNGTTAFFPREILDNPNSPKPNVTNIMLFDKPYKTDQPYWKTQSLTFPYTDNSLTFEFALPEYSSPERNTYAYQMEGVDHGWINAGNTHFARYPGLNPGHYKFKTKAANGDGVWGAENVVTIYIVPPFWQRGWFIILMVILGSAIVAGAVLGLQQIAYRRKIRAFEIQQKIQSERERISRDLHDNIGTQLSLINKSIKEAIQPSAVVTEDEKNNKLNWAQQEASGVIDVLRETIWALNKPEITLQEFADNLNTFIQKKLIPYPNINADLDEGPDNDNTILGSAEALNLFRICQEAVANTIKYATASLINVHISATDDKYLVIIGDNGIGLKPSEDPKRKSYGFDNMKYRASEIGCDLQIDSVPGEGLTIVITKR